MVRVGVVMMLSPRGAYVDRDVKAWLERAGATVVLIPPAASPSEAAAYFESIHGLFLHPGWGDSPAYTALIRALITMAVAANQAGGHFPIWGTCQGMQRLMQYFGGTLEPLDSLDRTDAEWYFHHEYGITLRRFMRTASLRKAFRVLATSHDRDGKEYVSLIEGIGLPFYGIQAHPEKPPVMDWMATFFVNEMRRLRHS
jgi:gamma-glutamyl hydrolase